MNTIHHEGSKAPRNTKFLFSEQITEKSFFAPRRRRKRAEELYSPLSCYE